MTQWLGPILDGNCLNNYPPRVSYTPKVEEIRNQTTSRYNRYHRLGYHYIFTIDWTRSLCTEEQYNILRAVVNKNQAVDLRPYPDKYYNSVFSCHIVGGLSALKVFRYIEFGYQGTLQLETIEPVDSMPEWEISQS